MVKSSRTTWGFKEELRPCGTPGLIRLMSHGREHGPTDVSKVLVSQPETHPWFIILWEPLNTKAPSPQLTQVWCCYANTVVFYLRGYVLRQFSHLYKINGKWGHTKPGYHYEEWDSIEYVLRWDSVVQYQNEFFKVGSGMVIWAKGRWWMRHSARRERKEVANAN